MVKKSEEKLVRQQVNKIELLNVGFWVWIFSLTLKAKSKNLCQFQNIKGVKQSSTGFARRFVVLRLSRALSIFRSNKAIYCQLIDDVAGNTLAAASSMEAGIGGEGNKSDQAKKVGKLIAEKAQAANITDVVFDRGGYLYHGRVKALADGAREGGLKF